MARRMGVEEREAAVRVAEMEVEGPVEGEGVAVRVTTRVETAVARVEVARVVVRAVGGHSVA